MESTLMHIAFFLKKEKKNLIKLRRLRFFYTVRPMIHKKVMLL